MQYALMELQHKKFLIDANEYVLLNSWFKKKFTINDYETKEEEVQLKLVYGAILIQNKTDKGIVFKEINGAIGKAIGYINNEKNICELSELIDIKLFEDCISNSFRIPFAALIKTNLEFNNKNYQAKSFFIRYSNMQAINNIFNRNFVMAIKRHEKRIKGTLDINNWENFIDKERAIRVAKTVL